MISNLPVLALAALSAVGASPLQKRQATSLVSSAVDSGATSVQSAASSAISSVESAATSAAEAASSSVAGASTTLASDASSMMTGAASTVAGATSTGMMTGNQTYSAFPCPTGYLLTYAAMNMTYPIPANEMATLIGTWANSTVFPNLTASMGANEPGATNTISIGGVELAQVLTEASYNVTTGFLDLTWNLTNGPINAGPVSFSNYTAELHSYDPTYYNSIGNSTIVNIFINFCASNQMAAVPLGQQIIGLHLANIGTAVASMTAADATMATTAVGAATTAIASGASSVASDATATVSSMASGAMSSAASVTSAIDASASSAAASVTSGAASGVSDATSAIGSNAAAATSVIGNPVSAVSSGVNGAQSAAGSAAASAIGAATTGV